MVTVDTDEDDRRWAEAEALANGVDDPERRRHRRNRAFLLIAGIIVASWVAGVAIGLIGLALPHDSRPSSGDAAGVGPIVALVIEGVGFVTMIVGFIWAVRTGRYVLRWRSIASPLSRRQKKQAQRAIAGKIVLVPDRTRYLVALAGQNRRTTEGITPLYGAIALIDAASLLVNSRPISIAFTLVIAVLFAIVGVQLTVIYRRSGRYIAAHEGDAHRAE